MRRPPDRLVLAAFIVTIFVGGANSIAVRFSLRELTPFWGASFRFFIATAVVAALVLVTRRIQQGSRRPLQRRHLLPILGYGLLNFWLTYVFLYTGLRDAPAATAAVITGLAPLLTLLFAVAHRIERFRSLALVGAITASTGIAVVFANQLSLDVPPIALLALIGAAACLAETGVLMKRYSPGDPLTAVALAIPIGAVCLLGLAIATGEPLIIPTRLETWLANAYLVVFGTIVGFSFNLYVLSHWTASANSYGYILSPLVTVVLGGLLLGEIVSPAFLLGGTLVAAGVYVATLAQPAPPTQLPEEPTP
ncbi:MAG: EamA family transporter [Chloroflexi bacterium]|nr:EamA family transporter [Chloroflexota bacterium]